MSKMKTKSSVKKRFRLTATGKVKAGDVVELREAAKKQLRVANALQISSQVGRVEWVDVDEKAFKGTFKTVPERGDFLPDIREDLVVELYSK